MRRAGETRSPALPFRSNARQPLVRFRIKKVS